MKNSSSILLATLLVALSLCTAHAQTWIIDGQQTQTLNLNVSDPQSFYSDGSREMSAPIRFAPELSNGSPLIRATVPWDEAEYDFFIFDFDEEMLDFCTQDNVGLLFENLYLNRRGLFERATGISINFEEQSLNGGWRVQDELDESYAIISRGSADARYLQKGVDLLEPLTLSSSAAPTSGMFRASIPWAWDHEVHDFFIVSEPDEAVLLSSSDEIGLKIHDMAIRNSGVYQTDEGTSIDFSNHQMNGGWLIDQVLPYDDAIISRGFADNRYHQKSAITTPLKFDPSLSSSVNGLFKATVPWDAEYEFFTFNPTYETVVLSPTVSSLGFEAAHLIMYGYGTIRLAGESTYISFEERCFGGEGWVMPTVLDDPSAIINRTYADTRYIKRSEGITTNHIFQAGDVLQIQNGIITAINP